MGHQLVFSSLNTTLGLSAFLALQVPFRGLLPGNVSLPQVLFLYQTHYGLVDGRRYYIQISKLLDKYGTIRRRL